MMQVILFLGQTILATLFIAAGATKLVDLEAFALTLSTVGIFPHHKKFLRLLALIVPILELAIGFASITGFYSKLTNSLLLLLLCCFITSNNDPNHYCPYSSGSWTSCSGLGTCGHGYRICTDCSRLTQCGGNYCTCLSGVICGGCCSKQAIELEMNRVAASLKGSAELQQTVPARC